MSEYISKATIFTLLAVGLAVASVLGLPAAGSCGSVYVCKGSNGGTHFTNTPTSADCTVFRMNRGASFSGSSRKSTWNDSGQRVNYSGKVPYHSQINTIGVRYRVDPNLIRAVIRTESSFNRLAVSRVGAQGLMQLMPETAKEMDVVDPFDPHQNIEGGTRYLRTLMDTFNGNLTLTLAAYNAGPTLVKRVKRIPRIPETVNYVKRVLVHYEGYSGGQPISSFSKIRVRDVVTIQ